MPTMNLKKEINTYLSTQRLMALATYGNTPWIANVYYVHDDALHLYFVSKATREHCKAIDTNAEVAVAIADSHQPIHKPQKGIQLHGTATPVTDVSKLAWIFDLWNKRIAGADGEKMQNPQQFLAAGAARVYEISPKRIKLFNTELWPKDQIHILELSA